MACCDQVGAQVGRIIEKGAEFNFSVTQNVGVWRASGLVLLEKVSKNAVPIFGSEISAVQRNVECPRYGFCISQIRLGSAVFGAVIFFPIFHE